MRLLLTVISLFFFSSAVHAVSLCALYQPQDPLCLGPGESSACSFKIQAIGYNGTTTSHLVSHLKQALARGVLVADAKHGLLWTAAVVGSFESPVNAIFGVSLATGLVLYNYTVPELPMFDSPTAITIDPTNSFLYVVAGFGSIQLFKMTIPTGEFSLLVNQSIPNIIDLQQSVLSADQQHLYMLGSADDVYTTNIVMVDLTSWQVAVTTIAPTSYDSVLVTLSSFVVDPISGLLLGLASWSNSGDSRCAVSQVDLINATFTALGPSLCSGSIEAYGLTLNPAIPSTAVAFFGAQAGSPSVVSQVSLETGLLLSNTVLPAISHSILTAAAFL